MPLIPLIEWLLPLGARAFDRTMGETALTRAGRHRLLRNALCALANAGPMTPAAVDLVSRAATDRRLEVREQAARLLAAD